MPKSRKKKTPEFVGDPGLASQSKRVLAVGRAALGTDTDIVDSDEAIALARAIACRLAGMAPEVRLAERRSLVSLIDDLKELSARLAEEKARIEQRMLLRAAHVTAQRAYGTGGTR